MSSNPKTDRRRISDKGIDYSTVLPHPQSDVFAWYTRPGAMRRLMPPWRPLTVISEADSLADGRAVPGLPAGLRWVARHDPSGCVDSRRFVDELRIGWWRHTHEIGSALSAFLTSGGHRVMLPFIHEPAEADQRVTPDRLLELGHRFRQPGISDALRHQLGR